MTSTTVTRPNVIVFFTDQQRWDTSGLHGNPQGLTPNFDRMALRGTHIYHSFTPQPVCGPARSILQTGLYATTTGCFHNGIALSGHYKTLAYHFRKAGYDTGYIGKWHLASSEPVQEHERGDYEYWLAANALEHTSKPYDAVVYDNNNERVKLPGYRVDAITDAAIRYIHDHQHHPFYLFISQLEPHQQNKEDSFPAPDGYQERYTGAWIPPDLAALGGSTHQHIAGYYGQVKRIDEALGRLLDAIKSLQLEENTILLFTSDHGNHFKTRNGEYKRSCHESSIRTLAALQGPGFTGGGRITKLISLIDWHPTLLEAAGIPIPKEMQGRSLLPLLHGHQSEWPEDVFIQISETQVGRALRTQRWKYSVEAPDKDGIRDASSDHYVERFLYDLEADPYELKNLVGSKAHRDIAATLRQHLIERIVAAGEEQPVIESA